MALSKEKSNECKLIFDLFDSQKEGKVSKDSLEKMLKGLGAYVPTSDLNDFIEEIGPTANYAQFLEFATKNIIKGLNKQELIEAFTALDSSKTGTISVKELKHALMVIGDALSEKEIDDLLSGHINSDETINYKKFVETISK